MHRYRRSFLELLGETPLENFLFYLAFVCFSFAEVLSTTAFVVKYAMLAKVCQAMLYAVIPMLLARMLLLRETKRQWIVSLMVFALVAYIYLRYKFEYPFWIFLFVFAGKGANLKKLAKITLVLVSILTVASVLACYAGVIENYVIRASGDRVARSAMGFTHPNRFGERIAEICIAYWYLQAQAHRGRVIALNLVALLLVNSVADSRGSSIVFAMLIVAAFLYPLLSRAPRLSVALCGATVVAVILLSYYLMVAYDPGNVLMASLNVSTSGRLSLMNESYRYSGLSLFGSDFSHAPVVALHYLDGSDVHFLVDNAYARLVLLNGLVPTALLLVLLLLVYTKQFKKQCFTLSLLGLSILLAFGLVENFPLDIQYNYFLFLISDVVFERSEASKRGADLGQKNGFDVGALPSSSSVVTRQNPSLT